MAEHTPTTEQVRKNWAYSKAGDLIHRTQRHLDEFDRWLAAHDREVRAEALREAAGVFTNADVLTTEEQREFAAWLMVRANTIEKEADRD